jgi:TPR repeat protein
MKTVVRNLTAAGIFLVCVPTLSWADFTTGMAAYESGDYALALKEFRPLAEKGDARAQFNLGMMYDIGRGVPRDYVQAHMWYNLAGAQGDQKAAKWRDGVGEKMSPAQIVEAQKLAREWKPKK